jgi:DnaD/phage-associated family protein
MQRDFKGIWIPRDIWLSTDLGWTEKFLLTEIDSLSQNNECFATNDYFANFFSISKDRVSKLISSLNTKGYVEVKLTYKPGTKQVEKRVITTIGYRRKQLGGIGENNYTPIGENNEDINTSFINSNINKEEEEETIINPFRFFEENGFGTIGGHISEKITAWCNDLSDELVLEAMKIAVEYGAKNWSYVERILKTWSEKKITSVSQVHAELMAFKEKQSKQHPVRKGKVIRQEMVPQYMDEEYIPAETEQSDAEAKKREVMEKINKFRGGKQ